MNVQRAIQLCVDTASLIISDSNLRAPETMAECFDRLHEMKVISKETSENLSKAVGLRNILVHEYEEVNWDIVVAVTHEKLCVFKSFASEVLKYL